MGKQYDEISDELSQWIAKQQMFFVATAPLAADGLVNCSPKGLDSFRVLSPTCVAYLDLTGSGIETIAHLRENGRIVIMFCAFEGPPKIVRLYGRGDFVAPETEGWDELRRRFPDHPGARAIVRVEVTRIADSCGYAVPRYDFKEHRDTLNRSNEKRGEAGVMQYRKTKNARSIDGLTGLPLPPPAPSP